MRATVQRKTLSSHDGAGHLEVMLCFASAVPHILAYVYLFLLILCHNLGLYKSGTFLFFLDGNVFFLEQMIHSVEKRKLHLTSLTAPRVMRVKAVGNREDINLNQ